MVGSEDGALYQVPTLMHTRYGTVFLQALDQHDRKSNNRAPTSSIEEYTSLSPANHALRSLSLSASRRNTQRGHLELTAALLLRLPLTTRVECTVEP